ncbi:hypothetical protein Tco_0279107, partial [Tanacetum coccineum]
FWGVTLFGNENNQTVDTSTGDQEDPNVNYKQEVKKTDDQEIENVKDEEGKNVEDQQVSEADDDTNNDDVGYMRQPIEDQDGSVRSIGVAINSDVADFGSEVRDKNLGVYELWKPSFVSHIKTIMWFKKEFIFIQERIWDPGIKIFQDNTLRERWF